MNKTLKITLCLLLVLGSLLCLCACGGNDSTPATQGAAIKQYTTGRYELQSIEWNSGTSASGEMLQEQEEIMGDMYVELFGDGTAQLSLFGQIKDMECADGQMWTADHMKTTYAYTVKDGKLTMTAEDATYYFVKK